MYEKLANYIPKGIIQNSTVQGDGTTLVFTSTLNTIVLKSSISIGYTIATVAYTATDDGAGNISGTDLTGTIDYTTGALTLTFTVAPDSATNISTTYDIINNLYIAPTTFGTSGSLYVVNSSDTTVDHVYVYLRKAGEALGLTSNLFLSFDVAAKSQMEIQDVMVGNQDSMDIQSTNGTSVFTFVGQEV